jgi:redox-sensitive bicupin YhaK (pirin superfamily)
MNRQVKRLVTAHRQQEGAGFIVRRPVPTVGLDLVDPFLLIDELGPVTYGPGEAVGAPDHPHRGFETVSYILEGAVEHEDSAGHRGVINAGDVQWMTAGGGIVHSEMPTKQLLEQGGRVHGFQIWVNLPRRLKMTQPRYQDVPAAKIPEAKTSDGLARGKIIAGAALGVRAVIETHTPIVFQDWTLEPGADVTIDISREQQVLAYVFAGAIEIEGRDVRDGQMAILNNEGDAVRLRGGSGGRLLLLAGVPHREPVARYGPFVMSTEKELFEAFRDFQSGRMGEITRASRPDPRVGSLGSMTRGRVG